ncbi:MAG: hypothetical protein NTY67_01015, partial [Cyanobacteria bacterium]|nr:hypothetical protein [Cyanobacteriota bacterium]
MLVATESLANIYKPLFAGLDNVDTISINSLVGTQPSLDNLLSLAPGFVFSNDFVVFINFSADVKVVDTRGLSSYLLFNLFGTPEIVESLIQKFLINPRLGLLYPAIYKPIRSLITDATNASDCLSWLYNAIGPSAVPNFTSSSFPIGHSFWIRGTLLVKMKTLLQKHPFLSLPIHKPLALYPTQIERLLPAVVSSFSYQVEEFAFSNFATGESPGTLFAVNVD